MRSLLIIVSASFLLGFLLGLAFRCEKQPTVNVDTLIQKKASKVDSLEGVVSQLKEGLKPLKLRYEETSDELVRYKILRDTVKIIEVQDSIIYVQGEIIQKQDTIIQVQDLKFNELKEINSLQVIQIEGLKDELKKSERSRKTLKTIVVSTLGAVAIVIPILSIK